MKRAEHLRNGGIELFYTQQWFPVIVSSWILKRSNKSYSYQKYESWFIWRAVKKKKKRRKNVWEDRTKYDFDILTKQNQNKTNEQTEG